MGETGCQCEHIWLISWRVTAVGISTEDKRDKYLRWASEQ